MNEIKKGEVIVACDFSSKGALFEFLKKFDAADEKPYLKIGMELFYAEGASLVRDIKERGYKIFLDLKLHDIPNTVKKAMKNLAALGVDMTNVHSEGGVEMMRAAMEGLTEGTPTGGKRPLLIAVTLLTSIDDEILSNELKVNGDVASTVRAYAENVKNAGLDGVVCSPLEAAKMGELGLVAVTPGIRLASDDKGDQKRVATPKFAGENGSTYIVVGRSITGAENPVEAYERCVREFA